jgi:hypothetical protein
MVVRNNETRMIVHPTRNEKRKSEGPLYDHQLGEHRIPREFLRTNRKNEQEKETKRTDEIVVKSKKKSARQERNYQNDQALITQRDADLSRSSLEKRRANQERNIAEAKERKRLKQEGNR